MLTISAYFLLVLAIAGGILLVTFLYKSVNNKTGFEEDDEKYSDLDLAIGNLVRIDQKFLDKTPYLIDSTDFTEILIPSNNTKENEIRVDLGIMGINVPKNKIIAVKGFPQMDHVYDDPIVNKKKEDSFARQRDSYSQDVLSQMVTYAAITDQSYEGSASNYPVSEEAVSFGNGGEFGGGGASSSWSDNNQASTYEPASNTSDYSSSSNDTDYGSSSDSSSYSND